MITWFSGAKARILGALAGVWMFIALIVASYAAGRRGADADNRLYEAEEALETMERVHEVRPSTDRADAIERLRANGVIR